MEQKIFLVLSSVLIAAVFPIQAEGNYPRKSSCDWINFDTSVSLFDRYSSHFSVHDILKSRMLRDKDENSPVNQFRAALGLNKQGKITTSVSMFANPYPFESAIRFFGAVKGFGAQTPAVP